MMAAFALHLHGKYHLVEDLHDGCTEWVWSLDGGSEL
jgi:hypothetical protein